MLFLNTTDYSKRQHIRNLIDDAYNKRNALVHGGRSEQKSKKLKLTTAEIVEELLNLTRQSINLIIKRLLSRKGVPNGEDFDKMLLHSTHD